MSSRQKVYVALAVSAGVCTGVGLFLYFRHQRKITSSKATSNIDQHRYAEITTANADRERRSANENGSAEMDFLHGTMNLTSAQAVILTGYLTDYQLNNDEKLHGTLTTIANIGTFAENQKHLADAGCIERLRELLFSTNNEATQRKVLLALNNLALNHHAITHFTDFVPQVIQLCQTAAPKSLLRLYALNLLTNMSVLEYLHEEYMKNIAELSALIPSIWTSNDEALAMGKTLVNLSTNKDSLEVLLKLSNVDLKTIVNYCAPARRSRNEDEVSELEEILLRYLTFYCNIADAVVLVLRHSDGRSTLSKSSFLEPKPHPQGALYFELFDTDKQMSAKTILRPQYSSASIHQHIRRLLDAMDVIRQIQFESSVRAAEDEFSRRDSTIETSTPKRPGIDSSASAADQALDDLNKDVNNEFEADEDEEEEGTILADGSSSISDQSRASFLSALSTNDQNPPLSPDKSLPSDNN